MGGLGVHSWAAERRPTAANGHPASDSEIKPGETAKGSAAGFNEGVGATRSFPRQGFVDSRFLVVNSCAMVAGHTATTAKVIRLGVCLSCEWPGLIRAILPRNARGAACWRTTTMRSAGGEIGTKALCQGVRIVKLRFSGWDAWRLVGRRSRPALGAGCRAPPRGGRLSR